MKTAGSILIISCVVVICLINLSSCKKSSEPTSSSGPVTLSMEIISYQDAPTSLDSNLCYIKDFVEWNSTGWRDTIRCDSLAHWFANSKYQITDLWFPNVDSRCANPINTENTVTLKLASSDTSLQSQGFARTSKVVSVCYTEYRHYIFSRN